MQNKLTTHIKPILASFAIIVIGIAICFIYFKQSTVQVAKNLHLVSIATSTPFAIATGEYPQFTNVSNEFNKKIQDTIARGVYEHSKFSQQNWVARYETATKDEHIPLVPKETERFEYRASTTIIRNDKDVISFLLRIYEFSGGAHGSEAIITFNYDLTKQKEITLDDFIKDDTQFLSKISRISRDMLRKELSAKAEVPPQQIDSKMLNDGTSAVSGNFQLFTLPSKTQAIFYFTQYQVAAYVFGSSAITVDLPLR